MGLLAGYCSQVWSLAFTGFKVGNRSNMNQNIISPVEARYWVEAFPKLLGCRVQEPGPGCWILLRQVLLAKQKELVFSGVAVTKLPPSNIFLRLLTLNSVCGVKGAPNP